MKKCKCRFLAALSITAVLIVANNALAQSKARKFDELSIGIGTPGSWWPGKYEEEEKVMKRHMLRYARQLRKEKARAYIIGYAPRVVEWESYDRSYGEMRAGQARERLSEFIVQIFSAITRPIAAPFYHACAHLMEVARMTQLYCVSTS